MNDHEWPITEEFWRSELCGHGTLYPEFWAVRQKRGTQSWRRLDGVVVLGDPDGVVGPKYQERGLDGQHVVIIQTKAARLNAPLFGQALLSQHLIEARWTPHCIHSVLLCTEDDPGMRTVTDQFSGLKVHIRPGKTRPFTLPRILPAEDILEHARRFIGNGPTLVPSAELPQGLVVEGIFVPDRADGPNQLTSEDVAGRHITTVHSLLRDHKPANLSMYLAGEVIAAQKMIMGMRADSIHSLVLSRPDKAVGQALSRYAEFSYLTPEGAR